MDVDRQNSLKTPHSRQNRIPAGCASDAFGELYTADGMHFCIRQEISNRLFPAGDEVHKKECAGLLTDASVFFIFIYPAAAVVSESSAAGGAAYARSVCAADSSIR